MELKIHAILDSINDNEYNLFNKINKIKLSDQNYRSYYVRELLRKSNREKFICSRKFICQSFLFLTSIVDHFEGKKISKSTVLNVPKSLINRNTVQSTAITGSIQSIFLEKCHFFIKGCLKFFSPINIKYQIHTARNYTIQYICHYFSI